MPAAVQINEGSLSSMICNLFGQCHNFLKLKMLPRKSGGATEISLFPNLSTFSEISNKIQRQKTIRIFT